MKSLTDQEYTTREISMFFSGGKHFITLAEKALDQSPKMRASTLKDMQMREFKSLELFSRAKGFQPPAEDYTKSRDKVFQFCLIAMTIVAIGCAVVK